MRRTRRSGHPGIEFGGSGEDSFVAVVVTKLTGALLFILLLTMVIMALLPKAADLPSEHSGADDDDAQELVITTPEALPDAIAGRPYALALAAKGGTGAFRWSVAGELPKGLTLQTETGVLSGTPRAGTPRPVELVLGVRDEASRATQPARLVVFESDTPLSTPSWWKPGLPPVPWKAWLEQGFGFLVLWLVHMLGMNTVASLERWSIANLEANGSTNEERVTALRRFSVYRIAVRLGAITAAAVLGVWLWQQRV
jgi:hypothetical protein